MKIERQHRPQQFQRIAGLIQESPYRRYPRTRPWQLVLDGRKQGVGVGPRFAPGGGDGLILIGPAVQAEARQR